jgi:hypothetical protein
MTSSRLGRDDNKKAAGACLRRALADGVQLYQGHILNCSEEKMEDRGSSICIDHRPRRVNRNRRKKTKAFIGNVLDAYGDYEIAKAAGSQKTGTHHPGYHAILQPEQYNHPASSRPI